MLDYTDKEKWVENHAKNESVSDWWSGVYPVPTLYKLLYNCEVTKYVK